MAARLGTWVVALALLLPSVPRGYARQAQPSPQAPPAVTSAVLIGLVVNAETGEPVEDASVTLTGRPAPARGRGAATVTGGNPLDLLLTLGGTGGAETVVSAGNGRFVFRGLPAAVYSVRAQAAGYVDETYPLRGTGSPVFVEIREGLTTARVTVRLRKQAVVTGTVVDEAGEPVIAATVRAYRRSLSRFATVSFDQVVAASTDDRGIYRLSGLVPGEYQVFVPQSQSTSNAAAADALMQSLLSGRMPEGGLGSLSQAGASPMDPRAIRVGNWRLLSSNVQFPAAGDGPLQAYRTVYYPAARTPSDASWISLRSGEERDGVDFALVPVITGRVTGTLNVPSGAAGGVTVRLVAAADRRPGDPPPLDVATGQTQADGKFTLLAIPPGQYRVIARRDPPRDLPADLPEELASNPIFQLGMNMQRGAGRGPLFGEAAVAVAPGESVDVAISAVEGVALSGRLEFQDGPPPARNEISRTAVALRPLDGGVTETRNPRPGGDATFSATGLLPGRYALTVSAPSQGTPWIVKKITAAGRDVTTSALVVEDKPVTEVVLTLTRETGTVRGSVRRDPTGTRDARTGTQPTLTAIAVPANYLDWTEVELLIQRVRLAAVGDDGTFRLGSLLPGEYLVSVVDETQVDPSGGIALLRALAGQATRITVSPGEGNTVSLGISRVPR